MNFFEDSFNTFALFMMDDLQVHLPTFHTALSAQQTLTKNDMTHMPHPPCSLDLVPSDFFLFPWMKNVLKGKHFANMEGVKKKGRSTKGIKINEFNTVLCSGKNVSTGVLHQMESTLKVTKV